MKAVVVNQTATSLWEVPKLAQAKQIGSLGLASLYVYTLDALMH